MSVAKIRKGALTIPIDIRKKANLEDGTLVSVEYESVDGIIILKPKSLVDQKNFVKLSKKGKKMIDEALDAEKSGELVGPFSDIKEALKALKESWFVEIVFTKPFIKDYKNLPKNIQQNLDRKISFLLQNIQHPSLRIRKVMGYEDVWEGSITMNYRFFFRRSEDKYVLLRVGIHNELLGS